LQLATDSQLPYPPDTFDVVFSINVAQFWTSPVDTGREIRRVLKPGGLVALAVQPRNKGATEQTALDTADWLSRTLTAAGFTSVAQLRQPMSPVSVVCAIGKK
jgi:SAM-dependent methyltransferase